MSETIKRRTFLKGSAALGALLAVSPQLAFATHESPKNVTLDQRLNEILLGRTAKEEKITLTMAKVAEDGSLVPCSFSVDHPMEANNFIKNVWLIVDKNPDPLLMHIQPKPALGVVDIQTLIRMADPSTVRVYAENSKGELFLAQRWVQATGGCG